VAFIEEEVKEVSTCAGVSGRGRASLGVGEFLFKDGAVIGNGSISQVRPEDKMATNLQNGDIIVLSMTSSLSLAFKRNSYFSLEYSV
jgi:hypothetical protein